MNAVEVCERQEAGGEEKEVGVSELVGRGEGVGGGGEGRGDVDDIMEVLDR